MPKVKLTDAVVSAALPQETIYDLNDTETPGLQCVINPKGKKTFKLRVRNFEKKIGVFPVVKCAEARKTALMWYGELIKGDKPGGK
ncbi:MAG: Arm DNA-binding domain-containing protein, partial [Alphaproteobacteria bacterium]